MFPPVESDNYLLRREQIGGKKRKNDHEDKKANNVSKRGGRGRGRGRGKVMKRPAAKPADVRSKGEDDNQESAEEEANEEDEVAEGEKSASSSAPCGIRRSRPLEESQEADADQQVDARPKAKAKASGGRGKGKGKGRASTQGEPRAPLEWEPDLRNLLTDCLQKCALCGQLDQSSKHDHMEPSQEEFVSYSIYWTRKAVGVKTRANLSEKWCQVAYFARDTPCPFTNYLLAERWVMNLDGLCKNIV